MNETKISLVPKKIENDQDLETYIVFINQTNPDKPTNVQETKIMDKGLPKATPKVRTLFYRDSEPIGGSTVLQCYWQTEPDRYTMTWSGALDDQSTVQEGIHQSLQIARDMGAKTVNLWASDRHPKMLAAARELGFSQVQVNPESIARLENFDFEPYKALVQDLESQGYEFLSISSLVEENRDSWLKRYYDFDCLIMHDVPLPYEYQPIPYEDWLRDLELEEDSWPYHLLALKDGEIAGLTMIFRSRVDPTLGYTGLTGTRRDHRRKKLATALKAINMNKAKQAGINRLTTDNEKDNPMLDLNFQLGFAKEHSSISFELVL